jgi:cholesterol oxidase
MSEKIDKEIGVTFSETMTGPFALGETDPKAGEAAGKKAGTSLAMHAAIEIRDLDRFVADPTHTGAIMGRIDFKPFGAQIPAGPGVFRLFSPTDTKGLARMVYELGFEHEGQAYYLAGFKEVQNDRKGTDLWNDTTTLLTTLHKGADASAPVIGAGVLQLGLPDLMKLTSTMRVTNASNPIEHMRALATFGGFFMGNLWETYGPKKPD